MVTILRLEQANNTKHSTMVGPSLNAPKPPTTVTVTVTATATIKFLCSYGGRILPRYPDGKLRYHGGHTRVLAVNRTISFSELMTKLGELCSSTVRLRCQLPTEDLDALVTITSDEDLSNLIEEYDRNTSLQSSSLKVRAFLSLPKKCSPSPTPITTPTASTASSSSTDSPKAVSPKSPSPSLSGSFSATRFPVVHSKPPLNLPFCFNKSTTAKVPYHTYRNYNYNRFCVVPTSNQNSWQ